jgi:Asp-tRNA(Asn)/Glu-tRNA(Gln) amidotransferase A subunit family amidase
VADPARCVAAARTLARPARGEVAATGIGDNALARIGEVQPLLNGFGELDGDSARAAARQADARTG